MTQSSILPIHSNWNPFTSSKTFTQETLLGSWSLNSMIDEDETVYLTADFNYNFNQDGQFILEKNNNGINTINCGSVELSTDQSTLNLIVDGEKLHFEIKKMTPLEMVLKHNSGLTYNFLKNA